MVDVAASERAIGAPFATSARRCEALLGALSAGPLLQYMEVPDRVPMVLPLLFEDHVQALQHGGVLPRVSGALRRDTDPFQLLRRRASDHFTYLAHAAPSGKPSTIGCCRRCGSRR